MILILKIKNILRLLLCIAFVYKTFSMQNLDNLNDSEYDKLNECFIFKGYMANVSYIIGKIYNSSLIYNLKMIKIYMVDSLSFDTDFKIDKILYTSHAPDLVIVSPSVVFFKPTTIDLSCERIPGYPDHIESARNGSLPGENGECGKNGFQGFNGGSLFIFANKISNYELLSFRSEGGQGGPGQNGIFLNFDFRFYYFIIAILRFII